MKNMNKYLAAIPIMAVAIVMGLSNCTKHDQVLDLSNPSPATPTLNTDTLKSIGGTATLLPIGGAAWDGVANAGEWGSAPVLTVHASVPDLGANAGAFTGFVGQNTDIKLQSMHDATNIYFRVEIMTPQRNVNSAMWYYNPSTTTNPKHQWTQEETSYTTPIAKSTNGVGLDYNQNSDGSIRPMSAQDQFVMMFNISCQTFNSLSCYAACHLNSPYGTPAIETGGVMHTNGPTERLDVWRARMLQGVPMNQANDCFIDDGTAKNLSGTLDGNYVNSDLQVATTDGGASNKATFTVTTVNSGTYTTSAPKWVIYNATTGVNPYTNNAILISETINNVNCVKVTKVDSMGRLTTSLGVIDPNTSVSGTDFQIVGSGDGPKCIPGSLVDKYTGSRGDVTCNAHHTGSSWVMLFSRKLVAGDNQGLPSGSNDVDFTTGTIFPFGVGAMINHSDNQHAICAGLILQLK